MNETKVADARLNIKINASGLSDKAFVDDILEKGTFIEQQTMAQEIEILAIVNNKITG